MSKLIKFPPEPGEWGFLSNSYPSPITDTGGLEWGSADALYYNLRTTDENYRKCIRNAKHPSLARAYGRNAPAREDWDKRKLIVMRSVLRRKFTQSGELRRKLVETGDRKLVHTSHWDTFWGNGVSNKGNNMLGLLLIELRAKLR